MNDLLDRIARFDREITERLSTRTERCRFGTAFFHEGFPRRWDSNFVWVQDGLDGRSVRQIEGGPALFISRKMVAEDAVQADIYMYHRIILPDRTA